MPRQDARLRRADWIDAALSALARSGLSAVAVEPLATQLGVTKGSFYAHFSSRAELLEAALERWVSTHGLPMFAQLDAIEGSRERMQALFGTAVAFSQSEKPSVQLQLLRETHDPLVSAALARVDAERMMWLAVRFGELGFDAAASRRRARIAYAVFIGLLQTGRNHFGAAHAENPDVLAEELVVMLLASPPYE